MSTCVLRRLNEKQQSKYIQPYNVYSSANTLEQLLDNLDKYIKEKFGDYIVTKIDTNTDYNSFKDVTSVTDYVITIKETGENIYCDLS